MTIKEFHDRFEELLKEYEGSPWLNPDLLDTEKRKKKIEFAKSISEKKNSLKKL